MQLILGYTRLQGICFRRGDKRFVSTDIAPALADPLCVMVNRNRGSGTRVLIDRLLAGAKPPGFLTEAKSHTAVATAIAQGRADWGVAIEPAAKQCGLGFHPLREERFDFVVPMNRSDRAVVREFAKLLTDDETRDALRQLGCETQASG